MTIQLEFNLENESYEATRCNQMQKQLDLINESLNKTRKRLFCEMGELKKICHQLKVENGELKEVVRDIKGEKIEWLYSQDGQLFVS